MEIYREVCCVLERLYERSSEPSTSEPSPLRVNTHNHSTADTTLTLSPADANYQVLFYLATLPFFKLAK